VRLTVQASLHCIENRFMFPASHALFFARDALRLQRAA
jgi:hypothetical protein